MPPIDLMLRYVCGLLSLAVTAQPATVPAIPKTLFSLSIVPVTENVSGGARLVLQVQLTNASSQPVKFKENRGADDFDAEVFRNGIPVPATSFGKSLVLDPNKPVDWVYERYPEIRPGQSLWYPIDITRRFDMTMEGDYVVRISRAVPVCPGKASELFEPTGRVSAGDYKVTIEPSAFQGGSTTRPTASAT